MNEDLFQIAAKAVIKNADGHVLILKQNNSKKHWDLPGGRMQKNSTIEETLHREIQEETGITTLQGIQLLTTLLTHIRLQMENGDTVGLVFFVYTCQMVKDSEIVLSDEHSEYKWATPEEAAILLSRFSIPFI